MLHTRVSERRLALADPRHPAGLQHLAAIAQLERFDDSLLASTTASSLESDTALPHRRRLALKRR